MNIPTYWKKEYVRGTDKSGRSHSFAAWGWSVNSDEEASAMAIQRANRVLALYLNHEPLEHYFYSNQPPREEIIDELTHDNETAAVITRNIYGALILNTRACLFVDIDLPPVRGTGMIDRIKLLTSTAYRQQRETMQVATIRQTISQWAERNPPYSFRLYQTFAGFRLLFTDREFAPGSDDTNRIFNELDADPLYVKLTRIQDSFRARLTPKPWRCGLQAPRYRHPMLNEQQEQDKVEWERNYEDAIAGYTVCKQLDHFGESMVCSSLKNIVDLHDRFACDPMILQLA